MDILVFHSFSVRILCANDFPPYHLAMSVQRLLLTFYADLPVAHDDDSWSLLLHIFLALLQRQNLGKT